MSVHKFTNFPHALTIKIVQKRWINVHAGGRLEEMTYLWLMKKLIAFLGAFMLLACAQNTVSEEFVVPDGAFLAVNPLTYTDIPDNDVIRVGEDYYMVSTTMFFCPGAPIMHSS